MKTSPKDIIFKKSNKSIQGERSQRMYSRIIPYLKTTAHFFFAVVVAQSCPTLCDPVDGSTQGFPVLHHFLELAQTHVHWVGDAIQPSHSLSPTSPPALNLSQQSRLINFYWSTVALQRVSFYWAAKWTSRMYTYTPSLLGPLPIQGIILSRVPCAISFNRN